LRHNRRSIAVGSNPIFAVLPLADNQSAFWSLHPYVYRKTFLAFLFSPAAATVAMERKNGNGTTERQKRQQQKGNGMVETRHKTAEKSWVTIDGAMQGNSLQADCS